MPQPQTQKAFDAYNCEAFCSCTLSSQQQQGFEGLEKPEGGGEVTLGREEGRREEGRGPDSSRRTRGRAPALGSVRNEYWREPGPEGRGAPEPLGDPSRRSADWHGEDDVLLSVTGSFAFQACILPPASAVALCRKEPSAAQWRSSHSIPAPHLLGAPARSAHAQEGGPGAECSCPSAGECQEPCEPARPLWEPQAASHSPNLPGY